MCKQETGVQQSSHRPAPTVTDIAAWYVTVGQACDRRLPLSPLLKFLQLRHSQCLPFNPTVKSMKLSIHNGIGKSTQKDTGGD